MSISEIKNEVRKYLWSKERCKPYGINEVSTQNIEEVMEYDISTYVNKEKLYCNFLFAEKFGEDIKDIIEDNKYDKDIRKI